MEQSELEIEYQRIYNEEKKKFDSCAVARFCRFPFPKEYAQQELANLREWHKMTVDDIYDITRGYNGASVRRKELSGMKRVYHYYYLINDEILRLMTLERKVPAVKVPAVVSAKRCDGLMEVLNPPYDFNESNYALLVQWEDTNWLRRMRFTISEVRQGYGNGIFPETDEGVGAFLRNGGDI